MEQMTARGQVEVFLVSPDGVRTKVAEGRNTLSYRCAGAMAHLFSGDVGMVPAKIGFAHGASGSSTEFSFSGRRDPDEATVRGSLSVTNVDLDPNPSFAKAATGSDDTLVASTTYPVANRVTFRATFTPSEETWVYGFFLKDASGNLLAVRKLTNGVQTPAGYALVAAWSVTFV